jgi:hypothetical protein
VGGKTADTSMACISALKRSPNSTSMRACNAFSRARMSSITSRPRLTSAPPRFFNSSSCQDTAHNDVNTCVDTCVNTYTGKG